jgi:hypothetical protein
MGIANSLIRAAALLSLTSVCMAVPVESVKIDLKPLIRAAAENRVQFAVQVPHRVSITSAGHWTNLPVPSRAEWNYAIHIPRGLFVQVSG